MLRDRTLKTKSTQRLLQLTKRSLGEKTFISLFHKEMEVEPFHPDACACSCWEELCHNIVLYAWGWLGKRSLSELHTPPLRMSPAVLLYLLSAARCRSFEPPPNPPTPDAASGVFTVGPTDNRWNSQCWGSEYLSKVKFLDKMSQLYLQNCLSVFTTGGTMERT